MSSKPAAKKAPAKKVTRPPVAKRKLDAAGESVILEMITEGRGYRYIAAEFGVSVSTLYEWIEADTERSIRCAKASEQASIAEDEAALKAIQTAESPFELAKAREEAIHRRWRAKALAPKRYGDKVQVDAKVEEVPKNDADIVAALAKFGIVAKLVDPGA